MTKQYFSSDFFARNRARLIDSLPAMTICIIAANGLVQRTNDVAYPFRQDSNFWYLTGLDKPNLTLVLTGTQSFLVVLDQADHHDIFDGVVDVKVLKNTSGVDAVYGEDEGWARIAKLLQGSKKIGVLGPPPQYDEFHGLYTNPARIRIVERLKTLTRRKLIDIRSNIARLRIVKTSSEIQAIEQAIAISSEAFQVVYKKLSHLKTETEVQQVLESVFVGYGVQHAYQPIVAAGKNACTIHYIDNNKPLKDSDLLLIDAGAEFNNYASDITRTYVIGSLSKRQRAVADAVIDVQDFAFSILKPGVLIKEYELLVEEYMGKVLKSIGLISVLERGAIRKYYPHATSHFLGLDTHDVGDYQRPLEPGMVLTVEPGIYIPDESIGIRIEDNVVVTRDGVRNMTQRLPRDVR